MPEGGRAPWWNSCSSPLPLSAFRPRSNGVAVLRTVFEERNLAFEALPPATDDGTGRGRDGVGALAKLSGGDVEGYFAGFAVASPDLVRLSIEFAFGEALSRDGLDTKAKLLAIIAMLGAAGNRADALRLHLAGALAQGVTREEIIEVLMQLSVYAGFPSALNAFADASSVFTGTGAGATEFSFPEATNSKGRRDRFERGRATLATSSGASGDAVVNSFNDIAPDLGRMIIGHSYGEVFSREGIDSKTENSPHAARWPPSPQRPRRPRCACTSTRR